MDYNPCAEVFVCSGCGGMVMAPGLDCSEPETGVVWCGSVYCAAKQMYIDAWKLVAQTYCRRVKVSA